MQTAALQEDGKKKRCHDRDIWSELQLCWRKSINVVCFPRPEYPDRTFPAYLEPRNLLIDIS